MKPIKFLNAIIHKTGDGIVISKDGCNALPGGMCYTSAKKDREESILRAKLDIVRLFMIEHSTVYDANIYYRMTGSGGAHLEWFTMEKHLKEIGMEIPEGLGPDDSMSLIISVDGRKV